MPTVVARDLIDAARIRHWSFSDAQLGDGAAVLAVNDRIRYVMLAVRNAIRTLVNTTVQQAGVVSGILVGLDSGGVPYYLSTFQDGFAVHLDGGGVPYIDTTEAPVAYDPLGVRGGTGAGWPMPADALALLSLAATYLDASTGPIDVVDEAVKYQGPPGRYPACYMSGNRLVPLRFSPAGGSPDTWTSVVSVTLSYIQLPTITALDDAVRLPAPLVEPLVAGLAELFANHAPREKCSLPEKAQFAAAARRAEKELSITAFDILGDFQYGNVVFED